MKKVTSFKPKLGNPPISSKAPEGLSTEARTWWEQLCTEYTIDDPAAFLLLQTALEAFDRMRAAQELMRTEGMVFRDKNGQFKPHPAAVIERDSRSAMVHALKSLNLDLEPLKDRPGRPTG